MIILPFDSLWLSWPEDRIPGGKGQGKFNVKPWHASFHKGWVEGWYKYWYTAKSWRLEVPKSDCTMNFSFTSLHQNLSCVGIFGPEMVVPLTGVHLDGWKLGQMAHWQNPEWQKQRPYSLQPCHPLTPFSICCSCLNRRGLSHFLTSGHGFTKLGSGWVGDGGGGKKMI